MLDNAKIIVSGKIGFKSYKQISDFLKKLKIYHYEKQDGLCIYCEEPVKLNVKNGRKLATVEHYEPVYITKRRLRKLKREDHRHCLKYGDLTIENTGVACCKCNSSRGIEITNPWDWKQRVMQEKGMKLYNSKFKSFWKKMRKRKWRSI